MKEKKNTSPNKECVANVPLNHVYAERLHRISIRFIISKRRTLQAVLNNVYGLESIQRKFRNRITKEETNYIHVSFTVTQFRELKIKQQEVGCISFAELCRKAIDRTLEEIDTGNFEIRETAEKYFSGDGS